MRHQPPGGSFFSVTATYPNGESDDTNAASGGIPEPQITGFEIRGNQVIHRIEWSLMPNWIGGEQQRFWELDGNTLSITTPPLRLEGRPQVSALVWERL